MEVQGRREGGREGERERERKGGREGGREGRREGRGVIHRCGDEQENVVREDIHICEGGGEN